MFVTSLFFGQEIQDLAGKFRNKLLEGSSSQDATEQQIEALTKVAHVVITCLEVDTHTHTHTHTLISHWLFFGSGRISQTIYWKVV